MAGHIQSSDSIDWATPPQFKEAALEVFGGKIDLDPCSNPYSIMGAKVNYRLPEKDGLVETWGVNGPGTSVWVNEPYGKSYMKPDRSDILGAKAFLALKKADEENGTNLAEAYTIRTSIADWVRKCSMEAVQNECEILNLLPASVDTGHYQNDIFMNADAICYVKGRIRFLLPSGKLGGPAPMACAVVYWGSYADRFEAAFRKLGKVNLLQF